MNHKKDINFNRSIVQNNCPKHVILSVGISFNERAFINFVETEVKTKFHLLYQDLLEDYLLSNFRSLYPNGFLSTQDSKMMEYFTKELDCTRVHFHSLDPRRYCTSIHSPESVVFKFI
uniref:Uncharacterized protein n=1 Tax=Heterorhabditis bacteriophora TaxID=37862 RepID=A0A1I7WAC0_HETBA